MPGGRDIYELPLPAVVSVLEGINLPRYPSVPAKLRARSKPVEHAHPRAAGAEAGEAAAGRAARAGQAGRDPGQRPRGRPARRGDHARDRGGRMSVLVLVEPRRGALAAGAFPRARPRRSRPCARRLAKPAPSWAPTALRRCTWWRTIGSPPTRPPPGLPAWSSSSTSCRPPPWWRPARTAAMRCSATSPRAAICPSRRTASRSGVTGAVTRVRWGGSPARGGAHPRRSASCSRSLLTWSRPRR